jgi:hypothetical protein
MKHNLILVAGVAALLALPGCTEKPQTRESGAVQDAAAFLGTGTSFAAPGWKQGDKVSWEQQLKTRLQNGQNDYTRVN